MTGLEGASGFLLLITLIIISFGTLLNGANMINKVIGNSLSGAEWEGML